MFIPVCIFDQAKFCLSCPEFIRPEEIANYRARYTARATILWSFHNFSVKSPKVSSFFSAVDFCFLPSKISFNCWCLTNHNLILAKNAPLLTYLIRISGVSHLFLTSKSPKFVYYFSMSFIFRLSYLSTISTILPRSLSIQNTISLVLVRDLFLRENVPFSGPKAMLGSISLDSSMTLHT